MRKINLGAGVGLVLGLIAVSGGVLPQSTVYAQPGAGRGGMGDFGGMGGFGGMNTPPINSRQFGRYLDSLNVSKEQREAAETLFDGYQDQVRSAEESMRERGREMRERMRDDRDPAIFEDMRRQMSKAREERAKLDESLFDDVKAILTSDQIKNWNKVDRAYRRDTTLRRGRLSGESVDVTRLLDNLELSADTKAAINPILEEYETELDRELIARNKVYDDLQARMQEMFRNRDPEAAQQALAKGRDAGARVRDLNQKFARRIEESLPDDKRSAFSLAAKRASFPDVYRPTRTERELAAALNLDDLDTAQKASLAALNESYSRTTLAVNDKLAAATRDSEMQFNIGQLMQRGRGDFQGRGGQGGGQGQRGGNQQDDNSPMADLRRQRRELDRTTQDKLDQILTKAQKEKLPRVEDNAPDGGQRMRRMRQERGIQENRT